MGETFGNPIAEVRTYFCELQNITEDVLCEPQPIQELLAELLFLKIICSSSCGDSEVNNELGLLSRPSLEPFPLQHPLGHQPYNSLFRDDRSPTLSCRLVLMQTGYRVVSSPFAKGPSSDPPKALRRVLRPDTST